MVTSIKVKDNSNLAPLLIGFGIFPLATVFLIFNSNLSMVVSVLIALGLLVIFMIFFFKNLISTQDEYAIVADQNEVTFIDKGTFKWKEINSLKTIDDNSIFIRRHPHYYLSVSLKSGKQFNIDVTNFDYQFEELASILKSLCKLDSSL